MNLKGLLGGFLKQKPQNVSSHIQSKLVDKNRSFGDNSISLTSNEMHDTPLPESIHYGGGGLSSSNVEASMQGDSNYSQGYQGVTTDNYGEFNYSDKGDDLGFYQKMNPETGQMEWYTPGADWGGRGTYPEGFVSNETVQGMQHNLGQRYDELGQMMEGDASLDQYQDVFEPKGNVSVGPPTIIPGGWYNK